MQVLNAYLDQCTEKQIKIALIDYFIPTFRFEGFSTASTPKERARFTVRFLFLLCAVRPSRSIPAAVHDRNDRYFGLLHGVEYSEWESG